MIWGVVKGILTLIIIGALLIGALGFYIGFSFASVTNTQYEQYMQETGKKNTELQALLSGLSAEKNNLKDQVANLQFQKAQLEELNKQVTEENVRLRQQVSTLKAEKAVLETRSTVIPYVPQPQYSAITPAQDAQITPSVSTYTAGTYPAYSQRDDYPHPQHYAVVTENIRQFAKGKSLEQLVNGVREITYINHGEQDGNNWIIQYADETLVKGKGDCTDKVLLLYACMMANGYDVEDMAVAVVTDCGGGYSHNVLLYKENPLGAEEYGHYSFTLAGTKWYMLDPTNWSGTPLNSCLSYYDDCYTIGNIYKYGDNSIYGSQDVPMHGLKVSK